MQKKFKFFCNRYYSDRVAFDAPEGFYILPTGELYEDGITFISKDFKFNIHVFYGNEETPFFDEYGCVKIGDNFKVKRGKFECDAFYFNYEKRQARFYLERYAFNSDKSGLSCVYTAFWVFDKNKYAAEKFLKKHKIKKFFDSIEYF